jgi:uncharacterized protein (TIGR00266 family)
MEFEIKHKPAYAMLVARLKPEESIVAESGAMAFTSSNIEVKTRSRGGLLGGLKVKLLGGQSFWVNDLIAHGGPGEVGLVSAPIGDMERLEINNSSSYAIQKQAFVASTTGVTIDTQWQGFTKGIFGQSLFMLKATGQGDVWINVFGAIEKRTLKAGEHLIVDNFHLVAFSDTCKYNVRKVGGIKATLFSGEGLVIDIEGPGDVLLQTKNIREFVDWLWPLIEPMVREEISSSKEEKHGGFKLERKF